MRSAAPQPEGARIACAEDLRRAQTLVERYGEDSLSPFILRPDKTFYFAADGEGVLAYRMIGRTALVSGDPVAPAGRAAEVLAEFLESAQSRGSEVVIWGASTRYLEAYRRLALRWICLGEEAFVVPSEFSLEGRKVRKVRQSVNRLKRRGWEVTAHDGRDVDPGVQAEIVTLEANWRAAQPRILGFTMGMGEWSPEVAPDDLYVLARSPSGDLSAMARFACHRGRLSLDVMRRVGDVPNGCCEAMICCGLSAAEARGVPEVSLNYAGLSHLLRSDASCGRTSRLFGRTVSKMLGRHFQLERLARFDAKFFPEWRPRYLVFGSCLRLPWTAFRVLQAEGYLPEPRRPLVRRSLPVARLLARVRRFHAAR